MNWYEETKQDFIKNISDSYTLNLAISILEDRKELLDINLDLQKQNAELKKENERLRKNAEHNDKVVDKINWENKILNNNWNELKDNLTDYKYVLESQKENVEGLDIFEEHALDILEEIINKIQELEESGGINDNN